MHLITPSLSLDNAFGCKRFKIVQCSILQASCKLRISGSCDEAMLSDILQDEFLQIVSVPLTRSVEIDTLSTLQISANIDGNLVVQDWRLGTEQRNEEVVSTRMD